MAKKKTSFRLLTWKLDFKTLLRWLLISQVWAFLLYLPELGLTTDAVNRYLLFWSFESIGVRLVTVVLTGLLIFAIGFALTKIQPRENVLTIGAIAGGLSVMQLLWSQVLANAKTPFGAIFHDTLVMFILGGLGVFFAIKRKWTAPVLAGFLGTLALIISPGLGIFWFNSFRSADENERVARNAGETEHPQVLADSETIPVAIQAESSSASSTRPENVFIFVFDAWSYRLTFKNGGVRDELPALKEFVESGCCFHDAHSPGCHTSSSMPRFLFQQKDIVAIQDETLGFWDGKKFVATTELPSLFTPAERDGYETTMVGWYHNYPRILRGVDRIHSLCYYDHLGPDFWQQATAFGWSNFQKYFGRFVARHTFGDYHILRNHGLAKQTEVVNEWVFETIERDASNQFAIFHMTLPHWPFCMDREGYKSFREVYSRKSESGAIGQLERTDRVIGELIAALKKAGRFDSSLVIMTSDHSWRTDPFMAPKTAKNMTHVPMIVKLPFQQQRVDINEPFSTSNLQQLLQGIADNEVHVDSIENFVTGKDLYHKLPNADVERQRPIVLP